jgi:hypothetical protein
MIRIVPATPPRLSRMPLLMPWCALHPLCSRRRGIQPFAKYWAASRLKNAVHSRIVTTAPAHFVVLAGGREVSGAGRMRPRRTLTRERASAGRRWVR